MLSGLIHNIRGKYSHYVIQALHLARQSPQTPAVFMETEDHLERKPESSSYSPFISSLSSTLAIKQIYENYLANLKANSQMVEVLSKMFTQDFLRKEQPPPQVLVFEYRQMVHEDMLRCHAKHRRNIEEQKNL